MDNQQRLMLIAAVHNMLQEADEEEEEEQQQMMIANVRVLMNSRRGRISVEGFFATIVPSLPDIAFRSHFRLNRISFNYILELIGRQIGSNVAPGPGRMSPELQLQLALWNLGNQEVHRKTSLLFDVCMQSSWTATIRVCEALTVHTQEFIYMPVGQEALEEQQEFEALHGFPNVNGSIDGCDFRIATPPEDKESYPNRKGFMASKMQAVSLSNRRFGDIFCGIPGSMHDARMFRRSTLRPVLANPVQRRAILPRNGHLIGDRAYPLATYLLTPFRDAGNLTATQRNYNRRHSKTRMKVEHSFGYLKQRFRCLKFINRVATDLIPLIIGACCILHNACISLGDDLFDEDEIEMEGVHVVGAYNGGMQNGDNRTPAQKRMHIADYLMTLQ